MLILKNVPSKISQSTSTRDADTWRPVANMTKGRLAHNCGLVRSVSGEGYDVVVVGGNDNSYVLRSMEVFSVETETWQGIVFNCAHIIVTTSGQVSNR